MAYRETELGLLLRLDPEKAAKVIARAYRRTRNGTGRAHERAAAQLGVGATTMKRWLRLLERRGISVREVGSSAAA